MILYFDGVCNLCNGFVDFLIKLKFKEELKFTSLQGVTAKATLTHFSTDGSNEYSSNEYRSVILRILESNGSAKFLYRSEAVFYLLKKIIPQNIFQWIMIHLLLMCRILPVSLTDYLYDCVAQNRYRLFGRRETCRLPTGEEKTRFLD